MKCSRPAAVIASAALLVAVPAASADMIFHYGLDLYLSLTLDAEGLWADGQTVDAGRHQITYQDVPMLSYSVDLLAPVGSGEVTAQPVSALRNGHLVAFLYETHAGDVHSPLGAAALAVAVWEVLYEQDAAPFDAGSGSFRVADKPAAADAANGLLRDLPPSYQPATGPTVLHGEAQQDMLIAGWGSIPEPATAVLLLLGAPWVTRREILRRA